MYNSRNKINKSQGKDERIKIKKNVIDERK